MTHMHGMCQKGQIVGPAGAHRNRRAVRCCRNAASGADTGAVSRDVVSQAKNVAGTAHSRGVPARHADFREDLYTSAPGFESGSRKARNAAIDLRHLGCAIQFDMQRAQMPWPASTQHRSRGLRSHRVRRMRPPRGSSTSFSDQSRQSLSGVYGACRSSAGSRRRRLNPTNFLSDFLEARICTRRPSTRSECQPIDVTGEDVRRHVRFKARLRCAWPRSSANS